jgi:hypothetical protein
MGLLLRILAAGKARRWSGGTTTTEEQRSLVVRGAEPAGFAGSPSAQPLIFIQNQNPKQDRAGFVRWLLDFEAEDTRWEGD